MKMCWLKSTKKPIASEFLAERKWNVWYVILLNMNFILDWTSFHIKRFIYILDHYNQSKQNIFVWCWTKYFFLAVDWYYGNKVNMQTW